MFNVGDIVKLVEEGNSIGNEDGHNLLHIFKIRGISSNMECYSKMHQGVELKHNQVAFTCLDCHKDYGYHCPDRFVLVDSLEQNDVYLDQINPYIDRANKYL